MYRPYRPCKERLQLSNLFKLFTVCTVCTFFTTVCGTVCRRSLGGPWNWLSCVALLSRFAKASSLVPFIVLVRHNFSTSLFVRADFCSEPLFPQAWQKRYQALMYQAGGWLLKLTIVWLPNDMILRWEHIVFVGYFVGYGFVKAMPLLIAGIPERRKSSISLDMQFLGCRIQSNEEFNQRQ